MTEMIMIGAGGHAAACLDVIRAGGKYLVSDLVDPAFEPGTVRFGVQVAGDDEVVTWLRSKCSHAFVAIGQIKSSANRRDATALLKSLDFCIPTVISPYAYVSGSSHIGEGGIVMHGAIVNAESFVGEMSIINNRALVDHGSRLGDFVHVSTGVIINGDCVIEDDCFIGSGSVVLQGVTVGARSVVAAGSVVTSNVPCNSLYRG